MKVFSKKLWLVLTIVAAFLTAVFVVGLVVGSFYETVINVALGAQTQKIVPDPDAVIYYPMMAKSDKELADLENRLCEQIEGEGAVLLKNNGALPLSKDTKFSCFSQSSVDLLYGGTGSGSVNTSTAATLKLALEDSFSAGCVNTELLTFYKTSGYKRQNATTTGGNQGQYKINEVPWSLYESRGVISSFSNYGDVALVVLARSGGEGADLPDKLCSDGTDGDYLRLSPTEIEMMTKIKSYKDNGTFKKVVVLLNSSNCMQLDFLDSYGIDAAMWIGDVGMRGINAVADILAGDIIPSGRIVDTFLKDNHSSPAMVNFGAYVYTNAEDYGLETAQNNTDSGVKKSNKNYVVYQEGIYIGYRYYETRYEDYVLGRGNAGDYDYYSDVAYPFGYGTSYNSFTYSDFSVTPNADDFTVSVKVKNEDDKAAKHTVQIYFQSPYAQYDKDNKVEKSAVELCGFDKKEIAGKSTETFTISISKKDLTSYDHMNAKTYVLGAGDYYFTAGTDAHDAINNILMAKKANGVNVDVSKMSGTNGTGDASLAAKWTNENIDSKTFSTSGTGYAITNRFDDADLNKYSGTADQKVTYLTRNDWTGTFPTAAATLKVSPQMWSDGLTHEESGRKALVDRYKAAYYPNITELPKTAVQKSEEDRLSAVMYHETKFDDPSWQFLIEQMSYSELSALVGDGFHITTPIASISLPGTYDENGPQGFTAGLTGGSSAMCYTSEDVMAATFNRDLVKQMGECIGEDFLRAKKSDSDKTKYAGMYGPGANIHRTPYSGRNFEYYSEDGWLSGEIAAVEVAAIQSRGVYVFTKHFALNDQEEGRYGISTWSNEQAIREVYLEGFEGSVVKGGGLGVMTSFNRLGVVWSGAHYGLMTEVLRNEWGMRGAAITDCSVSAQYMDYRLGVLAGQDLWDGYRSGMDTLKGLDNDPVIVSCCQRAAQRIVYSISRSHAINIGNASIIPIMPWWKVLIIALLVLFGVVAIGSATMFTISIFKKKHSGS